MPRNGSGTMSLTTSFVSDTTISSSDVNTLLTDIASEVTNSVAKDGQSSMTAQLKIFSGTVSAPGLGFASETGTGLYRIGGSNIGMSLSGTKYFDFSTGGLSIVGSVLLVAGNYVYRADGTDVPITDGGTGASDAATAAHNLGLGTADSPQFTAIELGNASDTTVARASAGDIQVEGNRVFRVGGTDVPVADGGTGASTATAARDNLGVQYAVKSDQVTASSTTTTIAPGTQQYHPSAAKAYGRIAQSSPSVRSGSYGIASVVKNSTGNFTVTLSTAMADTNGVAQANAEQTSIGAFASIASTTTVTVSVFNTTTGSASNTDFNLTVFGTQ